LVICEFHTFRKCTYYSQYTHCIQYKVVGVVWYAIPNTDFSVPELYLADAGNIVGHPDIPCIQHATTYSQ